MKKIIITAILVVGLAAGYAFAHNNDWGMRGNGGHMMGGNYGMMHNEVLGTVYLSSQTSLNSV